MTGHHSRMPATTIVIDSPSNPRLRAALRLRERHERETTGLTLVDGGRESLRAIGAGVEVVEAFVCLELMAIEPTGSSWRSGRHRTSWPRSTCPSRRWWS